MRHPFVLAVLALLVLAGGAAAAPPDDVPVPNVVGRTRAQAVQQIESVGLKAVVVDVADGTVGRVHSTHVPAGTPLPRGETVEVRVGIPLRVDTKVPDARGKSLVQAAEDLAPLYVLDVQRTQGPPQHAGLVVDQQPAPGEKLLFRGVLRLVVVEGGAAEGGVIVPSVVGKPEPEATAALQAAGLSPAISHVDDPAAPDGTVVSQDPASGAEIVAGGTVALRVAGPPPQDPQGGAAQVPNVLGANVDTAQQVLLLAGFVVLADFGPTQDHAPWTVFDQTPKSGMPAPAGSTVRIAVALPMQKPSQVHVPSLFGLTVPTIQQVLGSLGLQGQFQSQFSNHAPGTAFSQTPPPGAKVPTGTTVVVSIAKAPPGNWQPPNVHVPGVIGLDANKAFAKIVMAGLWPQQKHHIAPNAPLGVVDSQQPGPGALVPAGSQVRFYVPHKTTVPTLVGRTRSQAIAALQQADLNAQPVGPQIGVGIPKVVTQSVPPGAAIAAGSTVAFKYQFQGGLQVIVPNVLGMSKGAAAATLQAKGLQANLQGPLGPGPTKVIAQDPNGGAPVPPGTSVVVQFVFSNQGPQPVQVPPLLGMSRQAAMNALQNVGLHGDPSGPLGPGPTKVVSQNPNPGTLVNVGGVVHFQYVFGNVGPQKVAVPNLLGKSRASAMNTLQNAGLQGNAAGPIGPGPTKVVSQTIPPGTLVNPGTTVHFQYVFGNVGPQKVSVPAVVGLKKSTAAQVLQAKGLHSQFVGPNIGIGTPKVVSQNPPAGALVNPGTTITMQVIWTP